MNKKFILATSLITSLLVASIAQANTAAKPEKCPSVSAIQSVGVGKDVEYDDSLKWIGGVHNNKFDTNSSWTFVIAKIDAKDADDAFKKANASLASLQYKSGPVVAQSNYWVCTYTTSQDYMAAAISPAMGRNLKAATNMIR